MGKALKWGGIGCGGLLALVILIGLISAVAGGTNASPTAAPQQAAAARATVGATSPQEAASPVGKPTPAPRLGTRGNPIPLGEAFEFREGSRTFRVAVVQVQRPATTLVQEANMFNEKPPDGQEYLAVKLKLDYLAGPEDKPFHTDNGGHRFFAENRMWGGPFSVVMPEPKFTGQDIFPGATVEGWLEAKLVPVAALDEALLVFKDQYFALR